MLFSWSSIPKNGVFEILSKENDFRETEHPLMRTDKTIVVAINSSSDANLVGLGMELDAIAAVAVGGTPFTGGQATVVGSLIGALLIQLVRYTLLANGVPDAAALVVKGAIIAGAVWSQQRGRAT